MNKRNRTRLLRLASLLNRAAMRIRAYVRARTPKRRKITKEGA